MSVPSRLEVSFGQYAKSLIDEALAKLPSPVPNGVRPAAVRRRVRR